MNHTSNAKRALITGITGQDGAYLAQLLLKQGYDVHGLCRRSSSPNTQRIDALSAITLHYGDMTDGMGLTRLIAEIQPHEIYNLAAQSHVAVSFETPEYTAQADALGALRLVEAVRLLGLSKHMKVYQASTSELFGNSGTAQQSEITPFAPCSPYAAAKLYAYWIMVTYRQAYGMFACNGILFNHESPLRGETFVTRKITQAVARIYHKQQERVVLGNLDAQRDWGYAQDYVYAMWLMLQQEVPEDFVIATGTTHSVREFVEQAFAYVGISLAWRGAGVHERGINTSTGEIVVSIDPRYYRPSEVDYLCGDASKARAKLNWQPTVTFNELVIMMMKEDLKEPTCYPHQESISQDIRAL